MTVLRTSFSVLCVISMFFTSHAHVLHRREATDDNNIVSDTSIELQTKLASYLQLLIHAKDQLPAVIVNATVIIAESIQTGALDEPMNNVAQELQKSLKNAGSNTATLFQMILYTLVKGVNIELDKLENPPNHPLRHAKDALEVVYLYVHGNRYKVSQFLKGVNSNSALTLPSLFSSITALFQPQQQQTQQQPSLFGNPQQQQPSLFGNTQQQPSLFGNTQQQQPSLFGNPQQPQQPSLFSSLLQQFGSSQQQPSIFGNPQQQQPSLFGNTQQQPSLFGNTQQQQPSLFGNTQQQQPSLFANLLQPQYNRDGSGLPSPIGGNILGGIVGTVMNMVGTLSSAVSNAVGGFGNLIANGGNAIARVSQLG